MRILLEMMNDVGNHPNITKSQGNYVPYVPKGAAKEKIRSIDGIEYKKLGSSTIYHSTCWKVSRFILTLGLILFFPILMFSACRKLCKRSWKEFKSREEKISVYIKDGRFILAKADGFSEQIKKIMDREDFFSKFMYFRNSLPVLKNLSTALKKYGATGDISKKIEAVREYGMTATPQPNTIEGTFKLALNSEISGLLKTIEAIEEKGDEAPRSDREMAVLARDIVHFVREIINT